MSTSHLVFLERPLTVRGATDTPSRLARPRLDHFQHTNFEFEAVAILLANESIPSEQRPTESELQQQQQQFPQQRFERAQRQAAKNDQSSTALDEFWNSDGRVRG